MKTKIDNVGSELQFRKFDLQLASFPKSNSTLVLRMEIVNYWTLDKDISILFNKLDRSSIQ